MCKKKISIFCDVAERKTSLVEVNYNTCFVLKLSKWFSDGLKLFGQVCSEIFLGHHGGELRADVLCLFQPLLLLSQLSQDCVGGFNLLLDFIRLGAERLLVIKFSLQASGTFIEALQNLLELSGLPNRLLNEGMSLRQLTCQGLPLLGNRCQLFFNLLYSRILLF